MRKSIINSFLLMGIFSILVTFYFKKELKSFIGERLCVNKNANFSLDDNQRTLIKNNQIIYKEIFVSQEQLNNAGNQNINWLFVHGNYSQNRIYPGNQINTDNVSKLKLSKVLDTEILGPIQSSPLIVEGIAYVSTYENNFAAFDLKTGKKIWHYKHHLILGNSYPYNCCGQNNRGFAIFKDRLYFATLDGNLVCLSAKTGNLIWQVSLVDDNELIEWRNSYPVKQLPVKPFTHFYSATASPVVADGKVIIGAGDGDYPIRGFIKAFDFDTGKLIWKFYTIPSSGQEGIWAKKDPTGYDLKRDIEYEKKLLELPKYKNNLHLGAGVWSSPAIDLNTKTVFLVTGNPYPDLEGDERPGDNLYSDSLVAINLETGKYKWHFQYVPHDQWDLDSSSPPLLAEIEVNKKIIPVVVHANKVGHVYVHDRLNGKLINFSESMIPTKKWSLEKRDILKNAQGTPFPDRESGVNWSAIAYNPNKNLVYALNRIKNMDVLDDFDNYVYTGRLAAVDIRNGKIAWTQDSEFPMQGGVLYTTGNLIFYGNGDGVIQANNASTGESLWNYKCDAGADSPPASYMLDGKQYLIIGCGGNFVWQHKYGRKFYIFTL